jgi:hypothetical protein
MFDRDLGRLPHRPRIARVRSAGNIRGGDIPHQLRIVPAALAEIAI